ncbi:MAG: hypothetical protein ACOXZP_02550 [Minisyncoccales bacterium]
MAKHLLQVNPIQSFQRKIKEYYLLKHGSDRKAIDSQIMERLRSI